MGQPKAGVLHGVVQRRRETTAGLVTSPVPGGWMRLIGQGVPLERGIRERMEGLFGTDFSGVRVVEGPAASAIGARAFTLSETLNFEAGLYDPGTKRGIELLGHELAHVVQQRSGRVENPYGSGVAIVQNRELEAEAIRMGRRAAEEIWSGPAGQLHVQMACTPANSRSSFSGSKVQWPMRPRSWGAALPARSPCCSGHAMQRALGPLAALRADATALKGDCNVHTEVQGLSFGGQTFFSCNSNVDAHKLTGDKVGAQMGVDARRKFSTANSYGVAADKTTAVVVYIPSDDGFHAEQHLLRILAEKLCTVSERFDPRIDVYVAGYNCPCRVCEPVVRAFAASLAANYGATLHFDMTPRQGVNQHGGGGETLSLTSMLDRQDATGKFKRFIDSYTSALEYWETAL